jgi:HicB_like antitoxin of bacterial toxin-antitoxin system
MMHYPIKLVYSGDVKTQVDLLDFHRTITIHSQNIDTVLDETRRFLEEIVVERVNQNEAIPTPSSIQRWQQNHGAKNAIWSLVHISPSFFSNESERINISMSKLILARLDSQAQKMGKTRSAMIAHMALTYECDALYDYWIRSKD